jgi:hypothetical protein
MLSPQKFYAKKSWSDHISNFVFCRSLVELVVHSSTLLVTARSSPATTSCLTTSRFSPTSFPSSQTSSPSLPTTSTPKSLSVLLLFFIFYFFSSSKFKRIRVELYLLLQKLVLTLTTRSYITFKEAVFKVFKDYNKKSECVLYVALWNLKSQNDIF